ncbi:MAG: hypothetical protein RL264_2176 [Bacteroidota bacterium]|jgi:predicted extracellular nuclease
MRIALFLLIVGFQLSIVAQKTATISFYNVENLFDTLDGPNNDSEYLPNSKLQWVSARYNEKLSHIRQVLMSLNYPLVAGFSEVENREVVEDIIRNQKEFSNYKVVHFESPDVRGIDVALIYNTKKLKLIHSGTLKVAMENNLDFKTRDILFAKFALKKDTFSVMVNHWPSRLGGQESSEPKRILAATVARKYIDSSLTANPNAKIVLMGDLNDHLEDKAPQLIAEKLTEQIVSQSGEFGGTHYYNNEWGILDHIFTSPGFAQGKIKLIPNSGKIHSFPYLLETYKEKVQPKRTYAGSKYLGGYSDHLPVSITITLK